MPYRLINVWTVILGLAGLLVVALMVLFGTDLAGASRTGPRWKRRTIAASLAVLAAIGVNVASRKASLAMSSVTPDISNKIRPGLTTATK